MYFRVWCVQEIANTTDITAWLQRTSSTAMRSNGDSNPAMERERLWGERFAGCARSEDHTKIMASLKELFNMDIDYDVEDGVKTFVTAFAILVNYAELIDLEDRAELMKESVDEIKKTLPCSTTRSPGTHLGSVLHNFQNSTRIFEDAVLHSEKCSYTLRCLKPFQAKLAQFTSVLGSVINVLECDDALIKKLFPLGRQIATIYTDDLRAELCVGEFVPTVQDLHGLSEFPLKFLKAAMAVLKPIVRSSA